MSSNARKRLSNEENEDPERRSKMSRYDNSIISGRIRSIELENFMCHEKLRIDFNIENNNCFYIGGPNGSGKSALFAALNIGLGGRGNMNDRGSSVKNYIKEGKRSAKIKITLTNRGQGSHPDYGDFSVIERTIGQTSSTYCLKRLVGTKETKVTTRKSELDKLMHRYGIQLANPIFWMSQDRSRHFLQQMKPEKLYQIFIFATELDHTRDCYEKNSQILYDIKRICTAFDKTIEDKKKNIKRQREARNRTRNIEKDKVELAKVGWLMLWIPLRDAKYDSEQLLKTHGEIKKTHGKLKLDSDENRKERAKILEELNDNSEELEEITATVNNLKDLFLEKDKARSAVLDECNSIKSSIEDKTKKMRHIASALAGSEREIKAIENSRLSSDKRTKKDNLEAAISSCDQKLESSKDDISILTARRKELQDAIGKLEGEDSLTKNNKQIAEKRKRDAENDIRMSSEMMKNAVARFGADIPRLLDAIRARASSFEQPPIGPIGQYIKLRDPTWTLAVEQALKQQLSSFILSSQRDRKTFEEICRQLRLADKPGIFVTKFSVPPHDTSQFAPPANWMTIDRMLDISDCVVRNLLIDTTNTEATILLESDREARDILNGQCPDSVKMGMTKSGGRGYPSGQGKQYRFYPNTDSPHPQLLVENRKFDIAALRQEIMDQEETIRKEDMKLRQVQAELNSARREHANAKGSLTRIGDEKERLTAEKRRLRSELEAMEEIDDDSKLLNLRTAFEESKERLKKMELEKEELEESRKVLLETYADAQEKTRLAKKNFSDEQSKSEPLKARSIEVTEKLHQMDATYEKYDQKLKKIGRQMENFHSELVENDKKIDAAEAVAERRNDQAYKTMWNDTNGVPPGYTDPIDYAILPSLEDATKLYEDTQTKITEAETAMGGEQISDAQMNAAVAEYNESAKQYKRLRKIKRVLEMAADLRDQKFPILRHAITMRLKYSFQKLMAMRHYAGELRVRNENRVIDITVHTHKKDQRSQRESNVLQDLKGLSGGERSYTTACFIMSLWEIMEAPFRCMDEFDVFMDMVNRKVVMELLVKLATEQFSQNQFIFFTPQGIRELGTRNRVQMFEMPKVRD